MPSQLIRRCAFLLLLNVNLLWGIKTELSRFNIVLPLLLELQK